MPVQPTPFGALTDGRAVHRLRLTDGALAVELLDYGAVVRSLRVGGVETVLGFDTLDAYVADRAYQGCVVGRCANRIDRARFALDGQTFRLEANEGPNTLHGGPVGFGRRLWSFEAWDDRSVVLALRSPDGEEGFPGTVEARVAVSLGDDALTIVWSATADRPTPVNLTHHLYFNLSGDPSTSALDHTLGIAADAITPVRPDLIPTGDLMAVDGTAFDLRRGRAIAEVLAQGHPQLDLGGGVDHNWVLGPAGAVTLACPRTGLRLDIVTDQPGIQVYSGQGLTRPFAVHGGIALEPQGFPDAVNRPNFPDVILRPGQTYRRQAAYRFSGGAA